MKKAFTLIELIVAASIVVLLVSVAVPRYNKFSLQQDFNRSVQGIASCLQSAQQAAAAPSQYQAGAVSYALSTISTTSGTVTCTTDLYSSGATFASDGSYLLNQGGVNFSSFSTVVATPMALCSVQSTAINATVSTPNILRIRFDASNRGIPLSVITTSPTSSAATVGVGSGADASIVFAPYSTDVATSCTTPVTKATVQMSRLGIPIQVCTTYGTSCI